MPCFFQRIRLGHVLSNDPDVSEIWVVDAVHLGYGLCGNALNHADNLFKGIPLPVLFPMEREHPVDDCVGLIIGGRDNYYAEQCRCAGTLFMNSGFSRHWKINLVRERIGEDNPQKRHHH